MIIRIVKMELMPGTYSEFLDHFNQVKAEIRQFPGCLSLELHRDTANQDIVFTISSWESAQDLENYRHSEIGRAHV